MNPGSVPDKQAAQILFAAWLAENQPQLFNALAQRAGVATAQPMKLEGFTDILRSIGSGISTAAKTVVNTLSTTVQSVGNFLNSSSGQETLATLATVYAGTQGAQTIALQADRAAASQAPAPIQMQWDPARQQYVPTDPYGAALSNQQLSSMGPSFLNQYGLWIVGGGLALLLLTQLMRRK